MVDFIKNSRSWWNFNEFYILIGIWIFCNNLTIACIFHEICLFFEVFVKFWLTAHWFSNFWSQFFFFFLLSLVFLGNWFLLVFLFTIILYLK
jgi:hypothetical protein